MKIIAVILGMISITANAGRISPVLFQEALIAGVTETALQQTYDYLNSYHYCFPNKQYVTIIDYTKHSSEPRMFVLDTHNNRVYSYLVAHGLNSDLDNDGYAESFSDQPGSKKSPLGVLRTAEIYRGKNGLSLRLDGIEIRNQNSRRRAIVIHGANYVNAEHVGRSWGCPAIPKEFASTVINIIKSGGFIYLYSMGIEPEFQGCDVGSKDSRTSYGESNFESPTQISTAVINL